MCLLPPFFLVLCTIGDSPILSLVLFTAVAATGQQDSRLEIFLLLLHDLLRPSPTIWALLDRKSFEQASPFHLVRRAVIPLVQSLIVVAMLAYAGRGFVVARFLTRNWPQSLGVKAFSLFFHEFIPIFYDHFHEALLDRKSLALAFTEFHLA